MTGEDTGKKVSSKGQNLWGNSRALHPFFAPQISMDPRALPASLLSCKGFLFVCFVVFI
jgi:hypothetical protein